MRRRRHSFSQRSTSIRVSSSKLDERSIRSPCHRRVLAPHAFGTTLNSIKPCPTSHLRIACPSKEVMTNAGRHGPLPSTRDAAPLPMISHSRPRRTRTHRHRRISLETNLTATMKTGSFSTNTAPETPSRYHAEFASFRKFAPLIGIASPKAPSSSEQLFANVARKGGILGSLRSSTSRRRRPASARRERSSISSISSPLSSNAQARGQTPGPEQLFRSGKLYPYGLLAHG